MPIAPVRAAPIVSHRRVPYLRLRSGEIVTLPSFAMGADGFTLTLRCMIAPKLGFWPRVLGGDTHRYYGVICHLTGMPFVEWGRSPFDGTAWANLPSAGSPNGLWFDIAVTYDRSGDSKVRHYRNRTLFNASNAETLNPASFNPQVGGANIEVCVSFCGIWTRALSAAEIAALPNVIPTSGLWAYYPCDDGAGNTLRDASGNGNHGTITGGAWVADESTRPTPLTPIRSLAPVR